MSTLPVLAPRCPVCGEDLGDGDARRCERCDTPHHPECWEYVPGCAVFGCADEAGRTLPTESWPEAHALVVRGMRWVSRAALWLQAIPLSFALGFGLLIAGAPESPLLMLPAVLAALATVFSMQRAFAVKAEAQRLGLFRALEESAARGEERRLARAVAERTGRVLPFPPGILALALSCLTWLGYYWPSGGRLDDGLPMAYPVLVLAAIYYGALRLPARWVGSQRILANRLGAAIEAGAPRKQIPGV